MTTPSPTGSVWDVVESPPPRRSGVLAAVLVVLSVLLLVGGLVMLTMARRTLADQDRQLAALQAQRKADAQSGLPAEPSPPKLDTVALRAQLTAVQTADKAVDASVAQWRRGGVQLKIVWEAVGTCMYRVDQYNRTAAWFTAGELGGLPLAIDLKAQATDCGKATLAENAKGAQY